MGQIVTILKLIEIETHAFKSDSHSYMNQTYASANRLSYEIIQIHVVM